MGLFQNYDRPGPGVDKNEPRKKGVARFFELLMRHAGELIHLNLLYSLCFLPAAVLFGAAALLGRGGVHPWLFLASVAASVPVGPATCALHFGLTRLLRDAPGFVSHDFWRKFRENFRLTVLPGVLCTQLVFSVIYLVALVPAAGGSLGLPQLVACLVALLLVGLMAPYYFLQAGYLQLGTAALLRNSLLLALRFLPRSLAGFLFGNVLWGVFVLFFPLSLLSVPLVLVCGFSLTGLLALMWIWPPVNDLFKIEETLNASDQSDEAAPPA